MPSLRYESATRVRASSRGGHESPQKKSDASFAAKPSIFAGEASDEIAPDIDSEDLGSSSTLTSCPSTPTFARPLLSLLGQGKTGAMRPPSQFGSAGLGMTLQWLQYDIAQTFCRNQKGNAEPVAYQGAAPRDGLGIRALGLTLTRWASELEDSSLKEQFVAACAREESAWKAIARAPHFPNHAAAARAREHGFKNLLFRLAEIDKKSKGERPPKVGLIYASVWVGLNDFERAYQILEEAQPGLARSPSVLSLIAFMKMMGPQKLAYEAHQEAMALCYGHLSGAPPVALMVLALNYEMNGREDLATACYILAATRPLSSGLDAFFLLGPGLDWLRTFRNRAHGANWMEC